jgi:hypothetical protein
MRGKNRALVVAALAFLALIPHWRTVLLGEVPLPEGYLALIAPELRDYLMPTPWNALWWDAVGQFWAWRTEAMRQLYEGCIPLWTNRVGCGFPFLANPQTQSLYPPTLLGEWLLEVGRKFGIGRDQPLPLRSARLMAWLVFLHTLLALAGAYLLIRSFGISRWASLVGSAAYGLGSFQTAWALLPTLPATAAWLPLTLWLVRQLFASAQAKQNGIAKLVNYAFALSLSLAMLLLAGHGQVAIYSLLAILLFALVEAIFASRQIRWVAMFAFIASFVFSFAIAAAQLLPTMELTPLTHRHAPPTWEGYQAFARRGLTLADWAAMFLPFLFGNPSDGSYFGKESFADYCAYAGFGVLVLAGLGIWDWVVKFLTRRYTPARLRAHTPAPLHAYTLARLHACTLFLLGALLASGSTFNLPLYFWLPGFSQLGTPTRAVFLCQLAIGMIAAKALDEIDGLAVNWKSVVATVLLLPVAVVFCVGFWLSMKTTEFEWRGWLALNVAQNMGVLLGVFALLLFALRTKVATNSSLLRYGVPILLVGELVWFATQQIPTARTSMLREALKVAEERLSQIVKPLPKPYPFKTPTRLLFLGRDWSLVHYPRSLLPPNSVLLLMTPIADARNYDSLLLRHHKAIMALFSEGNPCPFENGNLILMPRRWMDLDAAKRLAQIVGADAVVGAFDGELKLLAVTAKEGWQPRTFVPANVRYVSDINEAFEKLLVMPEDTVLLSARPKKHHGEVGDRAFVVFDQDSLVKVKVQTQRFLHTVRPIWLVLSDTAYPGWLAFTKLGDGRWGQLQTAVANGAFRACHLPDAGREVVWVYFPSSFAVGAFLSCVGVFCLAALLASSFLRSLQGLERAKFLGRLKLP